MADDEGETAWEIRFDAARKLAYPTHRRIRGQVRVVANDPERADLEQQLLWLLEGYVKAGIRFDLRP